MTEECMAILEGKRTEGRSGEGERERERKRERGGGDADNERGESER